SVNRLSSGYRINSAKDDASGLARAETFKVQARAMQAAMRNVNDGNSALDIADKSAESIVDILARMSELAASAAQGSIDTTLRGYYSDEYDKLVAELTRIVDSAEFGGTKLLTNAVSSITIFIGFKNTAGDQLSISLATLTTGTGGLALSAGILSGVTGALSAFDAISAALVRTNTARSVFGAAGSRLGYAANNLNVLFTNWQAAESRIRDVDFAYETSQLVRNHRNDSASYVIARSGATVAAPFMGAIGAGIKPAATE
ncbi:MAG: hypothetical protein HZB79_04915, partial [Deltaproteobacteria bacterium]|nr:hypothetical protein [Deltaproteobacteria bacterium]